MDKSVVLVHIGTVPWYLPECVFQLLLVNGTAVKVYLVINSSEFGHAKELFGKLDYDLYGITPSVVTLVALESLPVDPRVAQLKVPNKSFRDGFWSHTIHRFFLISALMDSKDIGLVFHIENDVMMYQSFDSVYATHCVENDGVWVIKDSPSRVIPCLLFFPNKASAKRLVEWILDKLDDTFYNDMQLLGMYPHTHEMSIVSQKTVLDGACIGQFLGGVDARNVGESFDFKGRLYAYKTTVGFVNETSTFKAKDFIYSKQRITTPHCKVDILAPVMRPHGALGTLALSNLHVHSKNLFMFSGIMSIGYDEIITLDRVLRVCDYTGGFNVQDLNLLDSVVARVFCKYPTEKMFAGVTKSVILYCTRCPPRLAAFECITQVYETEPGPKGCLLPFGVRHEYLGRLYKVMSETYLLEKTKDVFKDSIDRNSEEFFRQLAKCRFCECPGGLKSHLFWEALYLGVIPVLSGLGKDAKDTGLAHLPYVIKGNVAFTKGEYTRVVREVVGTSMYNLPCLNIRSVFV